MDRPIHVSVCICTFRRPEFLRRLLVALQELRVGVHVTSSIVVADNDAQESARSLVEQVANDGTIPLTYCCEPVQNIALARNRAIAHARGDFIAFLDDDEFPDASWLERLLETCEQTQAAGVLGPVRPHFDQPPPRWLIAGGFCERPEHATGTEMRWEKCRTGNVLFRRDILPSGESPFRAEFGTGGEDVDFFRRMIERGHVFVWCNEAVAYEVVPPSRWTRRYMLSRALLRGKNNLKLRGSWAKALLKSIIAVPAYSIVLPGALLLGQHVFMKFGIRFCDHLGRVLALVGMNPVKERVM